MNRWDKLANQDFGIRVSDVSSVTNYKPNLDSVTDYKYRHWPVLDGDDISPSAEKVLERKRLIAKYLKLWDDIGVTVLEWNDQPKTNNDFAGGGLVIRIGTKQGIKSVQVSEYELINRELPGWVNPPPENVVCEKGECFVGPGGYTGYIDPKREGVRKKDLLSSLIEEQNRRLSIDVWFEDELVPPISSLEHMEIMYRKNKQLK